MDAQTPSPAKPLLTDNNRLFLGILLASLILGAASGYLLAQTGPTPSKLITGGSKAQPPPKTAQSDTKTFRDFAEGTIQKREEPKDLKEYVEGTHLLIRDGTPPVALTSSVLDLSQYEGKKIKVFGETQKAIKEGWLMDVGRVEVQ